MHSRGSTRLPVNTPANRLHSCQERLSGWVGLIASPWSAAQSEIPSRVDTCCFSHPHDVAISAQLSSHCVPDFQGELRFGLACCSNKFIPQQVPDKAYRPFGSPRLGINPFRGWIGFINN